MNQATYNEHAFMPIQEVPLEEYRELQVRSRRFILHAVSEKSRVPLHKLLVRGVEPDTDQIESAPFTITGQVTPATAGARPEGWTHTVAAVAAAVPAVGTVPELVINNNPVADDRGFVSYGIQDLGQIQTPGGVDTTGIFPPGVVTVEFLSGAGTRLDQWDLWPLWSYVQSALGFAGIAQKLFAYVHHDEMIINHKFASRTQGAGWGHPYRMAVAEKYGKYIGLKT